MSPASAVTRRWRELVGTAADSALAELIAAYGGQSRHYHDLRHIAALLALSAGHADSLADRDTIDLAILYHDAIYEPTRSDNETKSAELARRRLSELNVASDRVAKAVRFIEATKHASAAPSGDSDLDHLLDFDLSILAAEPKLYAAYTHAIRREYAIYPDLLYRPGRAKVLRAFLAMPRIYRVRAVAAKWEEPARANLAAELSGL
jgi:predicted metal-dependent HD superfamily phosphohydrolase